MAEQVSNLSEKQVQYLIADYPWLLNLDYELIPELKNKGLEYQLTESKRADLILRDRRSGRPVIVEFKSVPFYRENIGQILEYRARIIQEYTGESSILKDIFEEKIFAPIMVLVVSSCTPEARLACNLSNIEIYEYDNKSVLEILLPEKKKTLDEFRSTFIEDKLPLSVYRSDEVDAIYNRIKEVLIEEDLTDGWKNYRVALGEYFDNLNHVFINKQIFRDYDISIGILEDIFSDSNYNKVNIEYYSSDIEILKRFIDKYRELNLTPNNNNIIDEKTYEGCCWSFYIDKKEFIEDTKNVVKPFIMNYVKIMKQLELMD